MSERDFRKEFDDDVVWYDVSNVVIDWMSELLDELDKRSKALEEALQCNEDLRQEIEVVRKELEGWKKVVDELESEYGPYDLYPDGDLRGIVKILKEKYIPKEEKGEEECQTIKIQ